MTKTSSFCIHLKPRSECDNPACAESLNAIGFASELAEEPRARGLEGKAIWQSVQGFAQKNHPIILGIVKSVTYEAKTDRYIAKFGDSSAKVSNLTAEFLLQELNRRDQKPTVYAKMTDGMISGCFLLYL